MEVVLIDDGSDDETGQRLEEYQGESVRVITHANKGFVRALTDAIVRSDSEYIAIHGSGDIAKKTKIKKQSEFLDHNPSVGLVGCRRLVKFYGNKRNNYAIGQEFKKKFERGIISINPFSHGEVMYRRSVYEKAGGYREFFRYAQDRDLWCRMSHIAEFAVLGDILYERVTGRPGSVSGDIEKLMQQRFLSEFAVYCHCQRLEGKPDPLDSIGAQSALMRPRSKRLAQDLARLSVRRWIEGDPHGAAQLVAAGLSERVCLHTLFASFSLTRFSSILMPPLSAYLSTRRRYREEGGSD
ncbi:Glycosyl transferase family 2 [Aquisalimonas asiatica]|uniref:Glycosyl transferase family 2 n=2 Tax=Aquisalimonas asiatica TaxID=406100 RepID=A0A1H8SPC2_9GAMM|nr:Glycosyl transferase family 2 [Aquisalimonas asiatica]